MVCEMHSFSNVKTAFARDISDVNIQQIKELDKMKKKSKNYQLRLKNRNAKF